MENSAFTEEYLAVLKRMDIISLIVMIILGLATYPLAFFVYFKLLTTHPFKLNYTFRLIVAAGIVDFLVYLIYLFFLQLSTFTVMNDFFEFLNRNGLSPIASGFMFVFSFLQILLSLSIAVNRLLFITKRHLLQEYARAVFVCSIVASLILAVACSGIIYMPSFTYPMTYMGEGVYAHTPSGGTLPSFLSMTLLTCSVSSLLLLVSLSLAGSVFKYRRQISLDKSRSIENGLIIVSISNFVIYILFVAALTIGYYFDILFLSYSVCLFITIACVSPFWCLLIFGKSMRRAIFTRNITMVNVPSVSSSSQDNSSS